MIRAKHFPIIDRLGMSLSILCAIHCLGTPILLMGFPWLTGFLDNNFFHALIFLLVFPLAMLSLGHTRSINSNNPFIMGVIGLSLLALGPVIHEFFHVINEHGGHHFYALENIVTILGGALLFAAHFLNLRSCKCRYNSSHAH